MADGNYYHPELWPKMPVPLESEEQQALFRWAQFQSGKYPCLDYLFHIPNGGKRSKAEAGRFRAEGVKAGVPDLCLPEPLHGYHGLYIEMKRLRGSKTTEDQKRWMAHLADRGYCVRKCKGWEEAAGVILDYLEGRVMK